MSDIFSVLADPTRRAILVALAASSLTVTQLVELTGEGQPSVSKHLKTLREAGLVSVQAAGQARVYSIDSAPLTEVSLFVNNLAANPSAGANPGANPDSGANPNADANSNLAATLGDVGEKLGTWIAAGAAWLGDQVAEKLAEADIDAEKLGREVGRKLADAKAQTVEVAADTEAQLKSELSQLSAIVTEKVNDLKNSGLQNLAAKAKAARANQAPHNED